MTVRYQRGQHTFVVKEADEQTMADFRHAFATAPEHRVAGSWTPTAATFQGSMEPFHGFHTLLRSLPSWPLVDGINLDVNAGGMSPDDHQFLPMDMLATGWLSSMGVRGGQGLERTRVLLADEGGTGKTLSACLALRYLKIKHGLGGPIIVLVPPLLIDHWIEHLHIVFAHRPELIERLSTARHFGHHHNGRIVVVSKFSWSRHFNNHVRKQLDLVQPLCVLVDEVHQGRTGGGEKELEDGKDLGDEQFVGASGLEDDNLDGDSEKKANTFSNIFKSLRNSIQGTARRSLFAIGLSATPINLALNELTKILRDLNAEAFSDKSDESSAHEAYLKKHGELIRRARAGFDNETKGSFFQSILADLDGLWLQDEGLLDDDREQLKTWLSEDDPITPGEALRVLRELHPYGRHLSLTLRDDLTNVRNPHDDSPKFRRRETKVIDVEIDHLSKAIMDILKREDTDEPILNPSRDVMRQQALILYSHRFNPWIFSEREGVIGPNYASFNNPFLPREYDKEDIQIASDARLDYLLNEFRQEAEEADGGTEEIRGHKIGAVIFTEWLGTLSNLRKFFMRLRQGAEEGLDFRLHFLKGGTGTDELKRIKEVCHREALTKGVFPILVTTPAGEVGIEMAWASNMVHWDIHTNPQRMEQRTWRVDRRIKQGSSIKPTYRVFFVNFEGFALVSKLKETVNERWRTSSVQLGGEEEDYIHANSKEVSGSSQPVYLWDEEIQRFRSFSKKEFSIMKSRWKTHVGLTWLGFNHDASMILDNGVIKLADRPGDGDHLSLQMTDYSSLVRDCEQVSTGLSRALSPTFPHRPEVVPWYGESTVETVVLPLFDHLMTQLGRLPESGFSLSYQGTNIEAIRLNPGLLRLHEEHHLADTGLRLKCDGKDGWAGWNEFDEEEQIRYGDQLLEIVKQLWIADYHSLNSIPVEASEIDATEVHTPELDERVYELERFVDGLVVKQKAHEKRLTNEEDPPDEEEVEWRKDCIEDLNLATERTQQMIQQMRELRQNHVSILLKRKED
jgi:hypothetical protein